MIAITGATGFVGGALATHLQKQNLTVRRLTRTQRMQSPDTNVVIGHIGRETDWAEALSGVDCVVHCAARVHVMNDREGDPLQAYRDVNTLGTLQLAESAAVSGVRRLIFLSSVKVLGESTPPGEALHALSPARPLDPYGQSKWQAEQALAEVALRTGLEVVIVRPPLVYGPGVGANFLALARAVRRGLPLPLASIKNRRSMVGLANLLDLLTICIHHPAATNRALLVSDGDDMSTPELVRQMGLAMGLKPRLFPCPMGGLMLAGHLTGRSAQVRRLTESLQVDIQDTKDRLNWRPPCSVAEELARTLKTLHP